MTTEIHELKVSGNSMRPFIRDGDHVMVEFFKKPKPASELSEGQVVFFYLDGEWVVHRLVKFRNHLITKGDWASQGDRSRDLWGQVIGVNGQRKSFCRNRWMAKLSLVDLYLPYRFFRRLRKGVMVLWRWLFWR